MKERRAKYTSGCDVLQCWVWHCHVHCAFNMSEMTEQHLTKLTCSGSDGPCSPQWKSCPYSSVFLVEDFFQKYPPLTLLCHSNTDVKLTENGFFFPHLDVEI